MASLGERTGAVATRGPGYRPLIPAFATIFMVATTVSFLAPLLLALTADLQTTLAEASQLVVATALAWALASPLTGLIGDRFGRRPVTAVCLIGMGLATLAGGFATDFRTLVLLRLAAGLFGSGGPPSIMAGIADLYPPAQRGRAVGWTMSGFSFAALVGVPVLGALGGFAGWRAAFFVTGFGLLGVAGFVWLTFPARRRGGSGAGNPLRAYRHLFGAPNLGYVLAANLFERITFMAVTLYFASFLIQSYQLTPVTVAPALAITALGSITGTISGGFLADRFPRPLIAALGLAVSAFFGVVLFVWPIHLLFSIAAGFGFGLSNAFSKPPHFSLAISLSEEHRGALLGLIALSNQVGFSLGAAIGGAIIGWGGYGGVGALVAIFGLTASGLLAKLLGAPPRRDVAHRPAG